MDAKMFGQRMAVIRKRRLLTQKQLAELGGFSARMCQLYETGKAIPKVDRVQVIADALEVEVNELLKLPDQPIPRRRNHAAARQ
jgi:transcriptional regulator with XRE-family HTH domain